MKRIQIIVLLALILILGGAFYWLTKDNEVSVVQEDKTTLSPTQVESIENIGQWEFLSVSDEELIDTIRRGFFGYRYEGCKKRMATSQPGQHRMHFTSYQTARP